MKTNALIFTLILFVTSCNKSQKTFDIIESLTTSEVVSKDSLIDSVEVRKDEESPIQLVVKHELTENDLYTDYDGGTQLADYFLIELIDKDTFLKNKSMAINKLIAVDTTRIKKQKGIIKLPSNKGEISFVDNLSDNESRKEYSFFGEIDLLNVYLMSGNYWEDWNYFFVDKSNGNTVQTFSNYPYLSADGKHIISIDFDTFEGTTYIDLYDIPDNKEVNPNIGMYVKEWIPIIDNPNSMYWANDNFLYIPVIHNQDYWVADGNFSELKQYIRLKPIG